MILYLLCLSFLIRFPELQLSLNLLTDLGDLSRTHGWLNTHRSTVLHNSWRAAVLSSRRWRSISSRSGGLLVLLSLLASSAREVVLFVFLEALDSGIVDLSLSGSGELRRRLQRCVLCGVGRVEEAEERLSTADLIEVGLVAGLGKHLLSTILALLLLVLLILSLLALSGLLAC